ncbi:MAG: dimethylsulfonioproprionate lyase family protein [Alphaproteobacteria bacterium]|nr:dimethylsulfonioproprionate lyase family protein [Alphaproteobacteria bacterium]
MSTPHEAGRLLGRLIGALSAGIAAGTGMSDAILAAAGRIFPAADGLTIDALAPTALPVCTHIPAAIATARETPAGATAMALGDMLPFLRWTARASDEPFASGHANSEIIGPAGLARSNRVRIGVSLVAPGITYPDHQHPPEEIYYVLSPGEWRQNAGPWHAPGIAGLVYNPPGIVHAMRAAPTAPLLALWSLWLDAA